MREAGNTVDAHGIASLEYAVAHLGTTMIVVLGHESCGAVAATASGKDPGTDSLRKLVAAIGPAVEAARSRASGDALLPAAVEENARRRRWRNKVPS